jgi:hypothetical protein
MVRNLIKNRIHRKAGETRAEFVLRRQQEVEDVMESIDNAVTAVAIVAACIIAGLVFMYAMIAPFFAPVDENPVESGYSDPEAIEWVAPEED